MCKSFVAITTALAILSLGSLAFDQAQAGNGAQGTPSKYSYQSHRPSAYGVTEFSSSSAPVSNRSPKR
jgi:hypothetical protein